MEDNVLRTSPVSQNFVREMSAGTLSDEDNLVIDDTDNEFNVEDSSLASNLSQEKQGKTNSTFKFPRVPDEFCTPDPIPAKKGKFSSQISTCSTDDELLIDLDAVSKIETYAASPPVDSSSSMILPLSSSTLDIPLTNGLCSDDLVERSAHDGERGMDLLTQYSVAFEPLTNFFEESDLSNLKDEDVDIRLV